MWLPRGRESREGVDWEFGLSRYKQLYIKWINNEILLHSTGNYIQYPMINHNGKEYKNNVCIYRHIGFPGGSAVKNPPAMQEM